MSTCRCCGQHIDAAAHIAPASQVVRVDDAVLGICNAAFEQARTRGHAHVEIAHAMLAMAMSEAGARALSGHGLDAQHAGQTADAWLGTRAQAREVGQALSTSPELKQVLHAAESLAQRAGRTHAALNDFIAALAAGGEALWPASFWRAGSAQHDAMRATGYEGVSARASGGVRGAVASASVEALRGETSRTVLPVAAVSQQSLLDRDYAWLRDMKRTQVSAAPASKAQTAAAPVSHIATAGTATASSMRAAASGHANAAVAPAAAAPRLRTGRDRDSETTAPGGARVTRLFATVPPPAAPVSEARGETSAVLAREDFSRAILRRLDTQEQTLAQRLDTQQRMIAELADAFARSMRELAQIRSEAVAAFARPSAQSVQTRAVKDGVTDDAKDSASKAGSASAGGAGSDGASQSESGRSGARRSRSRRGSWRRQSWSAWRRRQRRAERQSSDARESARAANAWGQWPDRMRAPREERTPRPDYAPHANTPPLSTPAIQPFDAGAAEHDTGETNEREKRFYLTLDDHIEKAPSIGPRTAALLNAVGIMTVRDLLTCDTADIAARLHNRYITADRLTQWQAQSRLVCTIPWLRGTHAQLLAGAGYDTIEKIVAADVPGVCAAILKFAATRDGMSVLRSSPPPGEDWVIKRLEHARAAEPQRAVA